MRVKIKINGETKLAYFPREVIEQGLVGEIPGLLDTRCLLLLDSEMSFAELRGCLSRLQAQIDSLEEKSNGDRAAGNHQTIATERAGEAATSERP